MFWTDEDKKRRSIKIVDSHHSIGTHELSDEIIDEIDKTEEEIKGSISKEEFQYIIKTYASAWAIKDKESDEYLKELRFENNGESAETEWTKNLRNAFVLSNKNKAFMLSINIGGVARKCEVVPLIYQQDPFYKSEE